MNTGSRRVVIALDPGISLESVLQAVLSLRFDANTIVHALLVEDSALLQVARLSCAREITLDARERSLGPERLETQFRAVASRLRMLFEAESRRVGLRCEFQVARGEPTAELIPASSLADVLVLTHSRAEVTRAMSQRVPLSALLKEGPPTLVFVQERWSTGQRVAVVYAGGEATNALRLGEIIALREGLDLSVLVHQDRSGDMSANVPLGEAIYTRSVRFRPLKSVGSDQLLQASVAEDARVFILPADLALGDASLVSELLKRADCSIICVR